MFSRILILLAIVGFVALWALVVPTGNGPGSSDLSGLPGQSDESDGVPISDRARVVLSGYLTDQDAEIVLAINTFRLPQETSYAWGNRTARIGSELLTRIALSEGIQERDPSDRLQHVDFAESIWETAAGTLIELSIGRRESESTQSWVNRHRDAVEAFAFEFQPADQSKSEVSSGGSIGEMAKP